MLSEYKNLEDINFISTFREFVDEYRKDLTCLWSWDNEVNIHEPFQIGRFSSMMKKVSNLKERDVHTLMDIYTEVGLIEVVKRKMRNFGYRISRDWERTIKEL